VPAYNGQNEETQDASMERDDSITGNNPDLSSMNLNDTMDMSGLPGDDDSMWSMADIIDFQDDNSWGVGWLQDDDEEDDNGPAGQALRDFKAFVAQARDHSRPLTYYEEQSVKLMHLLRRKGASLDTYDDVMKWHLESSGNKNPQAFISRHNMMKMLGERYNIPRTYLKERTIVLPSSGAKVNLVYHDARDIVVSLLTDPRFSDDDFLHFNNDPLAPPPHDLDYIADINTGLAYRETWKHRITKPGKQMLVPVVLYKDAAVTGQFDHLPVDAMKVGLGIMTREARDRGEAWRPVGTLERIFMDLGNYRSDFRSQLLPNCAQASCQITHQRTLVAKKYWKSATMLLQSSCLWIRTRALIVTKMVPTMMPLLEQSTIQKRNMSCEHINHKMSIELWPQSSSLT
jgi:hypothetical protein